MSKGVLHWIELWLRDSLKTINALRSRAGFSLRIFTNLMKQASKLGCLNFTKDELLYTIGEIRAKTFRPHMVKLSFELITEDLTSYNLCWYTASI
ncbi:hypothetical protein N7510_001034 [Penicillium lagena]|uniref:uncharacterized protein n=1 Tax=Penicillium lagena TaxID=94218 RepID=UPI0025403C39|nr:uncharacterized protein N7510_001034 [Penicillium lagena]KAJ5624725.1 hypothetical protein N7510_001034 [Penicillium lagena]